MVHVCRSGWPVIGGLESAVHGLAAALVRRGHQSTVVTLDRDAVGQRLHPAMNEGVRYVRRRRIGPRRYPFARNLRSACIAADVVHVHGIDGLVDQLVASRTAPIGLSTHGGFFHTSRTMALKRRWWQAVTRHTLARLDAVWFTSAADARRFRDVSGQVVENGIDAERFAVPRRTPDPRRWIVLGRVVAHKGLADLVAAVRRQRRPVDVIDLVGPVPPGGRAWVASLQHGLATRLRVWGSRSTAFVRDQLAVAGRAVFPSRYEGFGLAAREAMAAGVPTVVADVPGLREAVQPGVTGWRVDFTDPTRAAAVLDACRADGEALARAGQRAARLGDWSVRVAQFEAAYRAIR